MTDITNQLRTLACIEALQELVRLKDMKARIEHLGGLPVSVSGEEYVKLTEEYLAKKEPAWAAARAALAAPKAEGEATKSAKREPLPKGARIEYLGIEAVVVDDAGGNTLIVDSEGSKQVWSWKFDGHECTVLSPPATPVAQAAAGSDALMRDLAKRLSSATRASELSDLLWFVNRDDVLAGRAALTAPRPESPAVAPVADLGVWGKLGQAVQADQCPHASVPSSCAEVQCFMTKTCHMKGKLA